MTEKEAVIEMIQQLNNEHLLHKISALLTSEYVTEDINGSLIPDWFIPELNQRRQDFKNGVVESFTLEETKEYLNRPQKA